MEKNSPRRFVQPSDSQSPKTKSDWLSQMHDWRSEHRRALAKLAKLQAMLLHLDAELEESFHDLLESLDDELPAQAGLPAQKDTLEQTLVTAIDSARRQKEKALGSFGALIAELEAIQAEVVETLPDITDVPDFEDEVDEAAWESFPASDPPSHNPGRA